MRVLFFPSEDGTAGDAKGLACLLVREAEEAIFDHTADIGFAVFGLDRIRGKLRAILAISARHSIHLYPVPFPHERASLIRSDVAQHRRRREGECLRRPTAAALGGAAYARHL